MKEESAFNPMPHLDELLTQFETLATTALKIQSRNEQDDEFIRCGIVGFVQHSSSEHWDHSHFEYVRSHRNEVVDERFPADWCRFACLSAGYFLGMWEAGLIDDLALRQSSAITPGFMWLHAEAFGLADEGDEVHK